MQRWEVSHRVAYKYVKSKRRPSHKLRIGPNAGFRAQLCSWDAQLLEANSAAIHIEAEVPNRNDAGEGISERVVPEQQKPSKQQNHSNQRNPAKQEQESETPQQTSNDECQENEVLDKYGHVLYYPATTDGNSDS